MSEKDKSFIKHLGITQKDVADIVGCRQQTVSAGFAHKDDFFDLSIMTEVESALIERGKISAEDFDTLKKAYRSGTILTVGGSAIRARESLPEDYRQLWIIGDPADASSMSKVVEQLLRDLADAPLTTIVFAVSGEDVADMAFHVLTDLLIDAEKSPRFYLFQMAGAAAIPGLWIFDPQSEDPVVFTELYDGEMAQVPTRHSAPLIGLFQAHGYSIRGDKLYLEERRVRNSDQLALLYKTDNFVTSDQTPLAIPLRRSRKAPVGSDAE